MNMDPDDVRVQNKNNLIRSEFKIEIVVIEYDVALLHYFLPLPDIYLLLSDVGTFNFQVSTMATYFYTLLLKQLAKSSARLVLGVILQ